MDHKTIIQDYFETLDSSLDKLSLHEEGTLSGLPRWTQTTRRISIGLSTRGDGIALKITPDQSIEHDSVTISKFSNIVELNQILDSMQYQGGPLEQMGPDDFTVFSDLKMLVDGNPLVPPLLNDPSLFGFGREKGFANSFSIDRAKEDSIGFWNSAKESIVSSTSYVVEVQKVIDRFSSIVKRKSFLERRIHRFLEKHGDFLLPPHKRRLFEHCLNDGAELRKADFILEREDGMPALLIELESPTHSLLTSKNDLTAPITHACGQIADWVRIIDGDAVNNASDDLSFLRGHKDRLVIAGRGNAYKSILLSKRFNGTTIWTYDLLLEQAIQRLNSTYASQCALVGLEEKTPFHL